MPNRKGLLAPQNTFLDTIATRFDGTRKFTSLKYFIIDFVQLLHSSKDECTCCTLSVWKCGMYSIQMAVLGFGQPLCHDIQ